MTENKPSTRIERFTLCTGRTPAANTYHWDIFVDGEKVARKTTLAKAKAYLADLGVAKPVVIRDPANFNGAVNR